MLTEQSFLCLLVVLEVLLFAYFYDSTEYTEDKLQRFSSAFIDIMLVDVFMLVILLGFYAFNKIGGFI